MSITREIYEGFQHGEFNRWDAVIAPDVILDSPALREPMKGLDIKEGKVVSWYIAAASYDLGIYLWERGWPAGHNRRPKPIVVGIERR